MNNNRITSKVRYMRGTALTAITLATVVGTSSVALTAGFISNTPTVSGQTGGGTSVETTGPQVDVLIEDATPELRLYKTITSVTDDGDGVDSAGDIINYSFEVTNTGNVTVTNISVTDPLATVTGGTIASLAPGASSALTGTYTVTQADIDAGYFENSAVADGTFTDGAGTPTAVSDVSDAGDDAVETPDGAGATDTDPTNDPTVRTFTRTASLVASKTATTNFGTGNIANAGETVTYTITVENTGNVMLTGVSLTDTLLDDNGNPLALTTGPTFQIADAGSSVGTLQPGETATYVATFDLTQSAVETGSISNSVSVTANGPSALTASDVSDNGNEAVDDDGDTDPTNDPTVTALDPAPALTIDKSFVANNGTPVAVGDVITYTYTVANTGNLIVENIEITDEHNGVTLTSTGTDTAVAPTNEISAGPLSTDAGIDGAWDALYPGEEVTFTFVYTVTQADVDAQN